MANDPVDLIGGLADSGNVSKSDFRSYEKTRNVGIFATCSEVRGFDLSGRTSILAGARLFKKNTSDVSPDDGTEATRVIIDSAGNHWVEVPNVAVAVNATGLFEDRDDFDGEGAGFVYLSTDGDGGTVEDAVLFVKLSNDDSDWSDPVLLRGERGGDRYEITNWDTDRPASGEEIIAHLFTTDATFPVGFSASRAQGLVASTGTAVYSVKKNGTVIGTVTFPSSDTGVFALASETSFAAGDRFSVIAPNPRDETLSGVTMTFVASRE